jgi:hypothetical protein
VQFDAPGRVLQVPDQWQTWSEPPFSETATPHVFLVLAHSVTMSLSRTLVGFGFEVEPDLLDRTPLEVRYFAGDTLLGTLALTVDGDAGARLAAVGSPSRPFDRVPVTSTALFAIAHVRYCTSAPAALSVQSAAPRLTRGDTVHCTASVTPAQPFTVVRRRAKRTNVAIDENPNASVASGVAYDWSGEAGTDTKVRTEVEVAVVGSDADAREAVFDAWLAWHQDPSYQLLHTQFDSSDDPVIQQRIGCVMDLNPNDK